MHLLLTFLLHIPKKLDALHKYTVRSTDVCLFCLSVTVVSVSDKYLLIMFSCQDEPQDESKKDGTDDQTAEG